MTVVESIFSFKSRHVSLDHETFPVPMGGQSLMVGESDVPVSREAKTYVSTKSCIDSNQDNAG